MTEQLSVEKKKVTIYTDGACEPNPGPGGYGIILMYGQYRKEFMGGFRLTTNNRMELYAAIKGLELLKEECEVTLYSDSQYLISAMTKGWVQKWKQKNWWRTNKDRVVNIDLWEQLLVLCEKHIVEFTWVKGHSGVSENEHCDKLSYKALRETDLPVDEGYENKPEESISSKITEEGQPCRKCSTPVIKKKSKKQPKGVYYFEYYLYCPSCQTMYMVEEAKRQVNKGEQLF